MIIPVFAVTTSFFGGILLFAFQIVIWLALAILRIAIPIALFGIVLIGKGIILFVLLLLVSLWTYWWNIGALHTRLQTAQGFSGIFKEIWHYGHESSAALRPQAPPFSVVDAVQNTPFYRRFIAFADRSTTDPVTIQHFMSPGWIAHVLDCGLTRIVKLATPIAIHASDIVFLPIYMITSLFS